MFSQVPGTVNDSLSSNTQLGRAVQDACDELAGLQALVSWLVLLTQFLDQLVLWPVALALRLDH